MKKISFTLLLLAMIISGCTNNPKPGPEIVEIYSCEDNCEGSRATFLIQVYKDISNEQDCLKLKGIFSQVNGENVCKVE